MRRNEDQARRIRSATSAAMIRSAESRKCPNCNRKAALKLINHKGFIGHVCRWCGYEKGILT